MTRLYRFAPHPRRRAADLRLRTPSARDRWSRPEPLKLRAAFVLLGLGVVLGLVALLAALTTNAEEAGLLAFFGSALVVAGGLWLLFALGQRLVSRLQGSQKRCGCCRFYEVERGLYVIGRCQADPSRSVVSRADSCARFCFSERAMVCDRLAQHPRVLQQLHIIGSSDAANQ